MRELSQDSETTVKVEFSIAVDLARQIYPEFRGTVKNFEPVRYRYNEPWRTFHGIPHIADGYHKLRPLLPHIKEPMKVWWAWLYHDSVLVPGPRGMNEYCSAELAAKELTDMGMPMSECGAVKSYIRATADHLTPLDFMGDTHDLFVLLDVDLSGLADPLEKYKKSGLELRKEYALIDDKSFKRGQGDFCKTLLNRRNIFQSPYFAHLEERARENLEWFAQQGKLE